MRPVNGDNGCLHVTTRTYTLIAVWVVRARVPWGARSLVGVRAVDMFAAAAWLSKYPRGARWWGHDRSWRDGAQSPASAVSWSVVAGSVLQAISLEATRGN